MFNSYVAAPQKVVQIDVVPNPTDANATSMYTYTTVTTELSPNFANVAIPVISSYDIDLNTQNKYIDLL